MVLIEAFAMKKMFLVLMLTPLIAFSQVSPSQKDSTEVSYYYIDGDSIAVSTIQLDEVVLNSRTKQDAKTARIKYLILKRKTLKVYPYAKLAAERLTALNERLETLERKSEKRRYAKIIQRYIEDEFSAELKKLTRTEGQILVKLIDRQTGTTTFGLIKDLRSGWRAFWFNTTANLFDISLKREFLPDQVFEDFQIEEILQVAFSAGVLERQEPAKPLDFAGLKMLWDLKKEN